MGSKAPWWYAPVAAAVGLLVDAAVLGGLAGVSVLAGAGLSGHAVPTGAVLWAAVVAGAASVLRHIAVKRGLTGGGA